MVETDPTIKNNATSLAPPTWKLEGAALSAIPEALKVKMQRTLSEDIREQREDLKEAAEYTKSVVVELSVEGVIKWASPSWLEVVGTRVEDIVGHPIAELVVSDKAVFEQATEAIRKDDARSHNVRFSVLAGPDNPIRKKHSRKRDDAAPEEPLDAEELEEEIIVDLEGQGIMVYDRSTGRESHVS
jgi:serine/threonine-protein kinase RIM15